MTGIRLRQSTTIEPLDHTLSEVIAILERHFFPQVLGYYLVGSYAVGEAIPASDVDLLVVFKDDLSAAEQQHFAAVRERCKQVSAYTLDLSAESAAKLRRVGGVWFQTASCCLYGEDLRAQIPRKPVHVHMRDLMHSIYPLLARVRGNPSRLAVPLDYPDATGYLYGYDQRTVRHGDQVRTVGTKDLVTNTLAIANVRTLQAAGSYVGSGKKADIPAQYQHWIDDRWTRLVHEVYHSCRNRWEYALPSGPADRRHLRRMCREVLAFENDFVARYGTFLMRELQQQDAGIVRHAVQRLGRLIYADQEIVGCLGQLTQHPDADIVSAVNETLRWYERATP